MDINKIDTLVFSGGGTKGISFIGSMKYLIVNFEYYLNNNFIIIIYV